jgi:hypothetical protein
MSNNLNIIREVANFCEKEIELYNKILCDIPNISINSLYKMIEHKVLTIIIFNSGVNCNKYFNLVEALSKLDNTHILIFIEELELYLTFVDIHKCSKMLDRVCFNKTYIAKIEKEFNAVPTCSPYQIVLSNQRQKLTFTITGNDEDIKEVRKCCRDLFKCDTEINDYRFNGNKKYNEITVQLMADNLKESANLVEELKDYLHTINPILRKRVDIYPMDDIIYDNKRYYLSFLGKTLEKENTFCFDFSYYDKILKYMPEDNFEHKMMNEITQKRNVLKWLSTNLPKDGDLIDVVYLCYKNTPNSNITDLMFNNIIISLGYCKKKVNNMYVWKISI